MDFNSIAGVFVISASFCFNSSPFASLYLSTMLQNGLKRSERSDIMKIDGEWYEKVDAFAESTVPSPGPVTPVTDELFEMLFADDVPLETPPKNGPPRS